MVREGCRKKSTAILAMVLPAVLMVSYSCTHIPSKLWVAFSKGLRNMFNSSMTRLECLFRVTLASLCELDLT